MCTPHWTPEVRLSADRVYCPRDAGDSASKRKTIDWLGNLTSKSRQFNSIILRTKSVTSTANNRRRNTSIVRLFWSISSSQHLEKCKLNVYRNIRHFNSSSPSCPRWLECSTCSTSSWDRKQMKAKRGKEWRSIQQCGWCWRSWHQSKLPFPSRPQFRRRSTNRKHSSSFDWQIFRKNYPFQFMVVEEDGRPRPVEGELTAIQNQRDSCRSRKSAAYGK